VQDADDVRPPLTSGAVARIFNVHPTTVMDWADRGLLPYFRTPGGQRRFRPEDVEAFTAATEAAS
jgi:excisionase family DNA binding protein